MKTRFCGYDASNAELRDNAEILLSFLDSRIRGNDGKHRHFDAIAL